jgi:hypothetical protein
VNDDEGTAPAAAQTSAPWTDEWVLPTDRTAVLTFVIVFLVIAGLVVLAIVCANHQATYSDGQLDARLACHPSSASESRVLSMSRP